MPRYHVVLGSLIPASSRDFDFTTLHEAIAKRMKLDETKARLAKNKQDARALLRTSVRAQTKRIAAGAWD